tara:strand:- start:39 stop:560 length:522 start_codon:yes stop_codon:yes gene_type:complete
MYPIASGTATNIYYGDVVNVLATGFLTQNVTTGAVAAPFVVGTVGVFVGCTFTDPNSGNVTFRQNWPTGTVAADALAYVVDDPAAIFQVQANGTVAQAGLGSNCFLVVQATGTGNLSSGNSTTAAVAATVQTAAAFKIVGFVDSPTSTVGDAFTDLLVKFNPAAHAYTNGLGI